MTKKKTIDEVKPAIEFFEGYELLSEEYVNSRSKLKIRHSCGNIFDMSWNTFDAGQRCPKHQYTNTGLDKLLPFETVEKKINAVDGYKLLSKEYINSKSKLEIRHSCGNIFKMSWNTFSQGHRCPECAFIKRGLDQALPFETVEKKINAVDGYKLLSKEYINSKSKLEIRHSCGNIFWMPLTNFIQGQRCPGCDIKNRSGENHHNWNPNLTDEEREQGRKLQNRESAEWRKAIFERDDYTCQKCLARGGSLVAHHIFPWALFPALRFEVENGITLCEECHKRYHFLYRNGLECNLETLGDHLYSYTRYPSENENRFIENHQHLNNKDVNS